MNHPLFEGLQRISVLESLAIKTEDKMEDVEPQAGHCSNHKNLLSAKFKALSAAITPITVVVKAEI